MVKNHNQFEQIASGSDQPENGFFTHIKTIDEVLQILNMTLISIMILLITFICIKFLYIYKMRTLLINLFYICVFPLFISLLIMVIEM